MEPQRRFIFRGNAAAYGGRIYRPNDVVIEAKGASSLPVTGGRSVANLSPARFGEVMRVGKASTLAEGFFNDRKQAIELTNRRVTADSVPSFTRVSAQIESLEVGANPKLTIERIQAAMRGSSPDGSREPAIIPEQTSIRGVAIGGHKLIVEIDDEMFRRYSTRSKLVAAADEPKFVRAYGSRLFMHPAGNRSARLLDSCGIIHATIVKELRWAGKPYPGATIDQHSVKVPELGRIFFGELLITALSRRLTMVRLDLGSVHGGFLACADFDVNGTWSP
jgi:hypothetical protein